MRRFPIIVLVLASGASVVCAQEGRFDVQSFRPSGEPQDLVMVSQSRPLEKWSVAAGFYVSYSLDPLVLVRQETRQKALNVVGNRLELDAMASIGLFGWADVGVAIPLVLYQDSDNLADTGTEGTIQAFGLGDLRLTSKIAIPYLKRKPEAHGFGMAVSLGLNLPTGKVANFTSDGEVTYNGSVIADYRFKRGALIALNAGIWIRPDREWNGLKLGDMLPLGAALEFPILRRYGIALLGEAYTNVSLTTLANKPRQTPLEALFGARWYGSSGVTVTIGLGGGCDCAFGAPSFRFFTSIIWVPSKTREYEALERFKQPPPEDPDPDRDGVIGEKDRCPDKAGPVENHGCPDTDRDKDKVVDRLDKCPDEPGPELADGCPAIRIRGDKILHEQLQFYTDSDIIKPESQWILDELARFLVQHKEIDRVMIEAHTDVRASAEYNQRLSDRRARAVMKALADRGVEPSRMRWKGFGATKPLADAKNCVGLDLEDRKTTRTNVPVMTDECIAASRLNRRVELTIEHIGGELVLPKGALPRNTPLPAAGLPSSGMPKNSLPKTGLPSTGLPKAGMPSNALPTTMEPPPAPTHAPAAK